MSARAKTVNLLLYDGTLNGVVSIEGSNWNSGEMYSVPRDSVQNLLTTDACSKYGVYLLLSQDKVYVGQSSDLAKRLNQHISGKDWWDSAIILTTKDDSLNRADIDYLESILIGKAVKLGRLDCDNKNKGNAPKVDKFREVFLGQYLDEALFLMQLIGVSVFSESKPEGKGIVVDLDLKTRLATGTRAKSASVEYLANNGVKLGNCVNYSGLQPNRICFWLNPRVEMLSNDWNVVLNDNVSHELIVLSVPAGSLSMCSNDSVGLAYRKDKPELIDMKINRETLIEQKSGIDFSPYLLTRVSY